MEDAYFKDLRLKILLLATLTSLFSPYQKDERAEPGNVLTKLHYLFLQK
jgi:hypothetical protein